MRVAWNFFDTLPVLLTEARGQLPFFGSRVYGDMEDVMDSRYNMLLDNTAFRLALNVVAFVLWLGVSVALVAAAA